MNAVILSFDPNFFNICERKQFNYETYGSIRSARKAKDKLHKARERASETRERTLHGEEQNRMRMASLRESRDSDRFLVNTHVQSHALLR